MGQQAQQAQQLQQAQEAQKAQLQASASKPSETKPPQADTNQMQSQADLALQQAAPSLPDPQQDFSVPPGPPEEPAPAAQAEPPAPPGVGPSQDDVEDMLDSALEAAAAADVCVSATIAGASAPQAEEK